MFTLSLTKVQMVSQRVLAVLVAFVVACGLAAVAAPRASAAPRDFLRADATGTCTWDPEIGRAHV